MCCGVLNFDVIILDFSDKICLLKKIAQYYDMDMSDMSELFCKIYVEWTASGNVSYNYGGTILCYGFSSLPYWPLWPLVSIHSPCYCYPLIGNLGEASCYCLRLSDII